ncbi:hypothetical protein Mapa_010810 [Marchantia paleacea]|nr:hypothetical protein Mapa_010810 [Marchantia paleacea]
MLEVQHNPNFPINRLNFEKVPVHPSTFLLSSPLPDHQLQNWNHRLGLDLPWWLPS